MIENVISADPEEADKAMEVIHRDAALGDSKFASPITVVGTESLVVDRPVGHATDQPLPRTEEESRQEMRAAQLPDVPANGWAPVRYVLQHMPEEAEVG